MPTGTDLQDGRVHYTDAAAEASYDNFPDNVKFPNNSLMVRGTPPWHSAC